MSTTGSPTPTVFWGWHSESAIAAVDARKATGRIRVAAWFGNAPGCTHRLNPFVHQFSFDARPRLDHPLLGPLAAEELLTFCDMYSRVSRSRGLSIQELQHTAYCYFHYFAQLLCDEAVKLVMFSSPPHFGVDYLLYIAARKLGIETVFCYQTLFPDRFFVVRRLEDFGHFEDAIAEPLPAPLSIERRHEKELFYMKSVKTRPERAFASLANDMRRNLLRASSKPMSFAGMIEKYRENRAWNTGYPRHSVSDVSLEVPYVYFPLQLQPEMTTSSLGAGYADQLTALECLTRLIPEDWLIYVKENPKQTHRQRGASFFRRLSAIPRVRYVDKQVNTYALLKNARFVSAVTGTAGWEAVSGGKPALVFGRPWYLRLPGIVPYRPGMTLDEITRCSFSHEALEAAFNELMACSLPGVIDPVYQQIVSDYDAARNATRLGELLDRALDGRLLRSAR